jgi:hypothetical protein
MNGEKKRDFSFIIFGGGASFTDTLPFVLVYQPQLQQFYLITAPLALNLIPSWV